MNIKELIKESHDNAVEKGFYDCSSCMGDDQIKPLYPAGISQCLTCNGTGKDQNKNIPELLMLVITEISEAVEALREGSFTPKDKFIYYHKHYDIIVEEDCHIAYFDSYIKDTFEDEISDTFIRLFDLCGYLGIDIDESEYVGLDCAQNKSEALFDIIKMLCNLESSPKDQLKFRFLDIFKHLEYFCEVNNIDIEKHIIAKMEYNRYV